MKYIAIHDHRGTIASLIAGPPDGPPMLAALEPGQQATEVDLDESGLDLARFETEAAVLEALAAHRVDLRHEARLTRRDDVAS